MATVSTYLNFDGTAEEALNFYSRVFQTNKEGNIMRFGDVPAGEDMPPMPEVEKGRIMHAILPILGGYRLMFSDISPSMGHRLNKGNTVYITLEPDTVEEGQRLFEELSAGGEVEMSYEKMFWGDYFASFFDKYGIAWMINAREK